MSPFPSWTTILTVGLLSMGLCLVVYILVTVVNKVMDRIMEKRVEKALLRRRLANDTFRDENGYSWDLVLSFPVHKRGLDKISPEQRIYSTKYILSRLTDGGLEFRLFYGTKHDIVYCKVRADSSRLMIEADRINMNVVYDEKKLESLCRNGRPGMWGPLKIPDNCVETKLPPFRHIFGSFKYDPVSTGPRPDLADLYKRWKSIRLGARESFSTPSPLQSTPAKLGNTLAQSVDDTDFGGFTKVEDMLLFRSTDRLKLIDSILNNMTPGGCCLDIEELRSTKCISGYLALHDHVQLFALEREWLKVFQFPWSQCVDLVRDYFGERIGLFFVFLGHQTSWLIVAAIVGTGCWINVAVAENDPNALIMPYFAGFISLWTTFYLDSFRRLQIKTAQKWGMVGFEVEEQDRPQFVGVDMRSPVTGKTVVYFPNGERSRRAFRSYMAVLSSLTVAVGVLALLLFVRKVIAMTDAPPGLADIVTSIFISIQIELLNSYYVRWAIALNNYENHRTQTEFEDALIIKTFIFQFINCFGCLFYIAFMEQYMDSDPCFGGKCFLELQMTLGTIFMSRLVIGNVTKVIAPMLTASLNAREALANMTPYAATPPTSPNTADNPGLSSYEQEDLIRSDMSEVEKSFQLAEFDPLLGTFGDYANTASQFGFTTMFVTAFPLATLLAFINNYVEIRVNAWRLCQTFRRPKPGSAEDIGTWYEVFQIISVVAVATNAGIVCFTGNFLVGYSWPLRVWIFILMSAVTLM